MAGTASRARQTYRYDRVPEGRHCDIVMKGGITSGVV
jgi:hypothetical protein